MNLFNFSIIFLMSLIAGLILLPAVHEGGHYMSMTLRGHEVSDVCIDYVNMNFYVSGELDTFDRMAGTLATCLFGLCLLALMYSFKNTEAAELFMLTVGLLVLGLDLYCYALSDGDGDWSSINTTYPVARAAVTTFDAALALLFAALIFSGGLRRRFDASLEVRL